MLLQQDSQPHFGNVPSACSPISNFGLVGMRSGDPRAVQKAAFMKPHQPVSKEDQFMLNIDSILSGQDERTTIMIKNIPNKYTQQMLLQTIDRSQRDNYDFFYLPIDFKNNCNMGYAFINFVDSIFIVDFFDEYDGTKWAQFNSDKICKITYGRIQGKKALENNFSTMQQQSDKGSNKVRPMIADKPRPSAQ